MFFVYYTVYKNCSSHERGFRFSAGPPERRDCMQRLKNSWHRHPEPAALLKRKEGWVAERQYSVGACYPQNPQVPRNISSIKFYKIEIRE